MNLAKRLLFSLAIACLAIPNAFSQFPNPRFDGTVSNGNPIIINNSGNQTNNLRNAINTITARPNGGRIIIRGSNNNILELGSIELKSNVHIEISKNTTIVPLNSSTETMFSFGTKRKNDPKVTNVQIKCHDCDYSKPHKSADRYFKVSFEDEAKGGNFKVLGVVQCENFRFADMMLIDNFTKFNAISLNAAFRGNFNKNNPGATTVEADSDIPRKGMIENCYVQNASYGYGVVQLQVGQDISFKDLYGEGGVTLRMESGGFSTYVGTMNQKNVCRIHNIEALNVNCDNGKTAVGFAPHGRIHGKVVVRNVTSNGSAYAVKTSRGFIDEEVIKNGNNSNPGRFKRGIFENVTVSNVTSVFKNDRAQIKSKDWNFYPKSLRNKSFNQTGKSDSGSADPKARKEAPSIAAVKNGAQNNKNDNPNNSNLNSIYFGNNEGSGRWKPRISNITATGFNNCNQDIVYEDDKQKVCESGSSSGGSSSGGSQTTAQCKAKCNAGDLGSQPNKKKCKKKCKNKPNHNALSQDFDFFTTDAQLPTFDISPNPASDNATIDCPANSSVQIFNGMGSVVKSINNAPRNVSVDVSDLGSGLYYVVISYDSDTITRSLIVK